MKKLFTMLSVAACSAMTMAQSVTTHSVYDVNQNGDINVADAVSVAQAAVQGVEPGQTQQNVTADDLNEVLGNIYQMLGKLDQKLNYVMKESGISNLPEALEEPCFRERAKSPSFRKENA